MTADVETLIIGAGVIGLAIAAELSTRGQQVLVVECNRRAGSETSSRNSGVIHAGIYYPKGSHRAQLCFEGNRRLYEYCNQNGVPFQKYGKLIVATRDDEIPKLNQIHNNAESCGISDLISLNAHDAKAREPELACKAALFSPSTGIIDVHALGTALEGNIRNETGEIIFNTSVENLERRPDRNFQIETKNASDGATHVITAQRLIIAAGLHATSIADKLFTPSHSYTPPRTHYAKGHYYALSRRSPFQTLVYPIPSKSGLGIHLTLELDGRAKFGPDVTWTDTIDYGFNDNDGKRLKKFETNIRAFWPDLPPNVLHQDSTGIRPRTYAQHEPTADFSIHGPNDHGIEKLVALYGVDSPGLTCALAIAPHVAKLLAMKAA